MKKNRVRRLAVLLVMIVVLSGCGKNAPAEDAAGSEGYFYSDTVTEEAKGEIYDAADDVVEDAEVEPGAGVDAEEVKNQNRKLIKRYYLSLETREYEDLISYIEKATKDAGGYIETSNLSGTSIDGYGNRNAYFTLRVPVSGAEDFVAGLEEHGHMTNRSEEVEDVTLAYVDTQSRLEALRVEQDTLMKMLEQADTLDTILGIQSRLTEVRYQIESYESQIRTYDNLIEYTTISVDVYEVRRETVVVDDGSFLTRLKDRVSDNFYDFGQGVQNFIIWFIAAIPYWILLAVIVLVVILIVKRIKKRRLTRKELEQTLKSDAFGINELVKDADTEEKDE